jgi:hypothetical protein
VAQDEDLQLLRTALPPEQPYECEQVPNDEIDERPEQAALPRPRPRVSNLASPTTGRAADELANPTRGLPHPAPGRRSRAAERRVGRRLLTRPSGPESARARGGASRGRQPGRQGSSASPLPQRRTRRHPCGARPPTYRFLLLRAFSTCERADPAARFDVLDVRLSRRTFDAALAAFLPVVLRATPAFLLPWPCSRRYGRDYRAGRRADGPRGADPESSGSPKLRVPAFVSSLPDGSDAPNRRRPYTGRQFSGASRGRRSSSACRARR